MWYFVWHFSASFGPKRSHHVMDASCWINSLGSPFWRGRGLYTWNRVNLTDWLLSWFMFLVLNGHLGTTKLRVVMFVCVFFSRKLALSSFCSWSPKFCNFIGIQSINRAPERLTLPRKQQTGRQIDPISRADRCTIRNARITILIPLE